RDVQLNVSEFLVRQHFSVVVSGNAGEGQPILRATAGACRMLIIESPPIGWNRDQIRRYATADDRVFVVFGGTTYAEHPTWQSVLNNLWARLWRELGYNTQATPVLVVIATATCEADRLPWSELR